MNLIGGDVQTFITNLVRDTIARANRALDYAFSSQAARLLSEIPGVGLGIGVTRGLTTGTMLGISAGMESAIAISKGGNAGFKDFSSTISSTRNLFESKLTAKVVDQVAKKYPELDAARNTTGYSGSGLGRFANRVINNAIHIVGNTAFSIGNWINNN